MFGKLKYTQISGKMEQLSKLKKLNTFWRIAKYLAFLLLIIGGSLIPYFIAPTSDSEMNRLDMEIDKFEKNTATKLIVINDVVMDDSSNHHIYNLNSLSSVYKFIDYFNAIDETVTVNIIIDTFGGSLMLHHMAINALLNHNGNKKFYVPRKACSGGTLAVLSGNELFMNKNAFLSPIDPQLIPGDSMPLPAKYMMAESYHNGDKIMSKMATDTMFSCKVFLEKLFESVCQNKLVIPCKSKYDIQFQNIIKRHFFDGPYPHDHMFSVNDLKKMGFQINKIPNEILEIFNYIK